MKRFIWDALLVFLLVAVGSYVQNKETSSMDITQKVQQFEQMKYKKKTGLLVWPKQQVIWL